MDLKHLTPLLPAFVSELEKDAGIKDDLKAGTTKVLTALKSAPKKAGELTNKAVVKARSTPGVGKAIEMATDPLNTPDIGHTVSNLARLLGH